MTAPVDMSAVPAFAGFTPEAQRELALLQVDTIQRETKKLQLFVRAIETSGVWRRLGDEDGRPWPTLRAFLEAPTKRGGLGLTLTLSPQVNA